MTKVWNVSGKVQRVPGFGSVHPNAFIEMTTEDAKRYAALDAFSLTDPSKASQKTKSEADKDK